MASCSEDYFDSNTTSESANQSMERDNQSYHLRSAYPLPDPEHGAFYASVNIQNKPVHKNSYPKSATRKRRLWETAWPSRTGKVHVRVAFLVGKVDPEHRQLPLLVNHLPCIQLIQPRKGQTQSKKHFSMPNFPFQWNQTLRSKAGCCVCEKYNPEKRRGR